MMLQFFDWIKSKNNQSNNMKRKYDHTFINHIYMDKPIFVIYNKYYLQQKKIFITPCSDIKEVF